MPGSDYPDVLVTGVGVTSAIGQGQADFSAALLSGASRFAVMRRPGRQLPAPAAEPEGSRFLGAEIESFTVPDSLPRSLLRTASLSGRVALATVHEAWHDADLCNVDPERIGLIVGGSNFQQRELTQAHEAFRDKPQFLRPTYGVSFLDSDVCGLCTEAFGIRGFAYTVGGASASGQMAVLHALDAVAAGRADVCIAVGALMDLSFWEIQGLRSLGAMGSNVFCDAPGDACRPFDRRRDGFIFGESCGAVIVERAHSAQRPNIQPYARIAGWATRMDANRNANPSLEGEVSVIRQALRKAGLGPADIDYVNPHGTGSPLGDETELRALAECGLTHAHINTTKSIVGHGLSAAGAVELVATLLQMRAGRLHPSKNLEEPIDDDYNWVRESAVDHTIGRALKMSMGFGGINSAICVENLQGRGV